MNIETILNVIIGLFIYNIIIKAIGNVILDKAFNNEDTRETVKKTFQEKLQELKDKKTND